MNYHVNSTYLRKAPASDAPGTRPGLETFLRLGTPGEAGDPGGRVSWRDPEGCPNTRASQLYPSNELCFITLQQTCCKLVRKLALAPLPIGLLTSRKRDRGCSAYRCHRLTLPCHRHQTCSTWSTRNPSLSLSPRRCHLLPSSRGSCSSSRSRCRRWLT